MKRLQFKTDIHAPASRVYNDMLGLTDKRTYEHWTAAFNPTSTYEGTWEKGAKFLFVGTDEEGRRGGMASEIADLVPQQFVSVRHYGFLQGDDIITEGEEVEKWTGGFENYSFHEQHGVTTVTIDIDVTEEYQDYFETTWPDALNRLKAMVEASA